MKTILNSIFVYFILLFLMRLMGRRAPNMLTPFDMVLIFIFAGLSVPAIMRDERSLTNVFLGIMTIGMIHLGVSTLKQRFKAFGKVFDGTPIVLFSNGQWHRSEMKQMRVQIEDVMAAARQSGIEREDHIKYAILERDGYISVIPTE